MRRAVMWFLLVALSSQVLWSAGTPESKELRLLGEVDPNIWAYVEPAMAAKYPGLKLIKTPVNLADGSTMTMDAMVAAGTPPQVYHDYMGRVSKYVTPKFAYEIKTDREDFLPGTLEPLMRDGKLYGLPMPGTAQGMVINLKILKAIGEENFNFAKWTTDDFLRMAEKAKARGYWATYLFAGNQSGDYLWFNWLATFGGQMYKSGDYSKTVIDATPAGEKFFAWMGMLVQKGYAPPAAAVLTDDDYALAWAEGKILAGGWFPNWVKPYFDTVKKQGLKGADFDYRFVAFPMASDVKRVAAAGSYAGSVVHNSNDKRANDVGMALANFLTDTQAQKIAAKFLLGYPNRKSAATLFADPHWQAIGTLVAENGMLDLGITMPKFAEVRALPVPMLQAMYAGKASPKEAFGAYVKKVNEVLAR